MNIETTKFTLLHKNNKIQVHQASLPLNKLVKKSFISSSQNNTDLLRKEKECFSLCLSPFIAQVHNRDEVQSDTELFFEGFEKNIDSEILSSVENIFEKNIEKCIDIAIQMSQSIRAVHQSGFTIRNLTLDSFLYNRVNNKILLFDLMEASQLPTQRDQIIGDKYSILKLRYISPEMTGRMNRHVDYRSDFYSLGIILYKLLSGKTPFNFEDPLELIYAHLVISPDPLNTSNTLVPPALSNIILKLLEKNAEDRYQSIEGLIFDLNKCLSRAELNSAVFRKKFYEL